MVGMPQGAFKHEHKMKEGDYFPEEHWEVSVSYKHNN